MRENIKNTVYYKVECRLANFSSKVFEFVPRVQNEAIYGFILHTND